METGFVQGFIGMVTYMVVSINRGDPQKGTPHLENRPRKGRKSL